MSNKGFEKTEMSVKAKEMLDNLVKEGTIVKDSQLGREISFLKYEPDIRKRYQKSGRLDFDKIYTETILPYDVEEILLLKRCIQLNLTEEEAHEIIKTRYRSAYKDSKNQDGFAGGRFQTKRFYPEWCEFMGIAPDSNFPDW